MLKNVVLYFFPYTGPKWKAWCTVIKLIWDMKYWSMGAWAVKLFLILSRQNISHWNAHQYKFDCISEAKMQILQQLCIISCAAINILHSHMRFWRIFSKKQNWWRVYTYHTIHKIRCTKHSRQCVNQKIDDNIFFKCFWL